jgi:antitoxin PrlF
MSSAFELESTLTDRYQTTVPEAIRRALKLGKRDKICYTVQPNGQVVLTRAEDHDPALGAFLQFLARDMTEHPQHLRSVDAGLVERIRSLVAGIEVDLEAELSADDE